MPDETWTQEPVDDFGTAYDNVDRHGWYRNLDPTVEELVHLLGDGDILIDYSGGTGILLDRLKLRMFDSQVGAIIVDSSPKFLRVALEKFRDDPKVGVPAAALPARTRSGSSASTRCSARRCSSAASTLIASTNAIHLYPDLADTVASWLRVLRPGGHVLINSGNIRNPRARRSEWILDETVWVVGEIAEGLVRTDPRYAAYRRRPRQHRADEGARRLSRPGLPAARGRSTSTSRRSSSAGSRSSRCARPSIEAGVQDWYEFLCAYHDAVLGWVGGTEKVDGAKPSEQAVADRLALMRHAMDVLFHGRPTFQACWTYITCVNGR